MCCSGLEWTAAVLLAFLVLTLGGNAVSGKLFGLCVHIAVARHFWSPWGITIHQRP